MGRKVQSSSSGGTVTLKLNRSEARGLLSALTQALHGSSAGKVGAKGKAGAKGKVGAKGKAVAKRKSR
jgi:hypothetical protein